MAMRSIAQLFRSIICALSALASSQAFSPGSGDGFFSLSALQKSRARETSASLDASRLHFQILFVDDDNFHGRIAEGMLAKIAEYNDALFTLFPYSATIDASLNAPTDSAAPGEAVAVCESLGLCSTACSEDGTSFDLSYLDQYDLIIAMDDDIRSLILRSLPHDEDGGYEMKCRLLSEFLSVDFCGVQSRDGGLTDESLQDMIEPELLDRVTPFYDILTDDSIGSGIFSESTPITNGVISQPRIVLSDDGAAVPNQTGWPLAEAAMLVACAGIARFCLDTRAIRRRVPIVVGYALPPAGAGALLGL
eukprot:CAMPEP_0181122256 /NCGR_PEP_ID=MMETSP1071-20121207/25211_1 /TAXON_ID=35127 /ORGANISM="Thalassiosira sp., Strain NH16" /LENGTH=306 /DNA_ID=CAMNT_0023207203 /DNA_START=62 /DNA_END=982 /DNA_ORIENTATION=+